MEPITRRIRDYPVEPWPIGTRIDVPEDAQVLSAGFKNNIPVVYVSVPADNSTRKLVSLVAWFVVDDEEHKTSTTARYVGTTVSYQGGELRPIHVFAETVPIDTDTFLQTAETQGALS